MTHAAQEVALDFAGAVRNLVTEDDEPVDNLFSAKQQRLLVSTLYASYTPPLPDEAPDEVEETAPEAANDARKFMADANVGVFTSPYLPPLVPDAFLSLGVAPHPDWRIEEQRAYFIWEYEKPPDVVVEVVSNRSGHEVDEKRRRYAKMGVRYYVVYDPWLNLRGDVLRVYEPGFANRYRQRSDFALPEVGLQVTLWQGVFEGLEGNWLRWRDRDGKLLPTPEEKAAAAKAEAAVAKEQATVAKEQAIVAKEQAVVAKEQAATAEARAARLAAKLRELGIEPEQL